MPEPQHIHSPIRTSSRHKGKRLTKTEREQAQETFLQAYTLNGNIMLSCRRANIDRSAFYQWCEHDQEFSILYHVAEKDFADLALAEFRKRAMEGYEKPVISMGRIVYEEIPLLTSDGKPQLDSKGKPIVKHGKVMMERVASDTLLAMLVKRHFPEFREKQQIEHTGKDGGPIKVDARDYSKLTDDELALLEQLSQKVGNGDS
jgi:hypothetical protein